MTKFRNDMSIKYRLIVYSIALFILCIITYVCTGNVLNAISQFWFSAGILLVILLSLIDQPFFSKDANIFVNAVTASISLLLVPKEQYNWIFWTFVGYVLYLLISSYVLMWVRKNPLNEEKKIVQLLTRINRILGKPQTLFSLFFLWGAIQQFGLYSRTIIPLFWFWVIFLLLNVPSIANVIASFFERNKLESKNAIVGHLFGVQGKEIFLTKLLPFDKREKLSLFDPVEFKYKVGNETKPYRGIVIDNYFLNEEQWIKVLANEEIKAFFKGIPSNESISDSYVCKLAVSENEKKEIMKTFVGVVTENSDIEKIRFIYNSKMHIKAGQLLEIKSRGVTVYYQIVNAYTRQELLEAKNQSNYIIGEAIQLGVWDNGMHKFDKYGWVPTINSPIHLYANSIQVGDVSDFFEIGTVSETNLPVFMNVDTAITHHMAVLGVTGTGKSCFVRNLIKEYNKEKKRKIFIVDITGEHKGKVANSRLLFSDEEVKNIYGGFRAVNIARDNNYNKDTNESRAQIEQIKRLVLDKIQMCLSETNFVDIIDLPDVDNNQNMLEFISYCFKSIFFLAKKDLQERKLPQTCIVIEEAHTIIPEWSFVADSRANSKGNPALNAIAQVALQGRKYNVGLLIVAQRTATISKTVLTQCNSIVSFQEFDKTTIEYLANYYGDSIVKTLPNLKFRQAVASGKAFASTVPMIFTVPEISD